METTQIRAGHLTFDAVVGGPPDGELVLLLHGFPQCPRAWKGVLPELAGAGYRVVAPAQRGYSATARPREVASYGIECLVGDVLAIADRLGAERFHVVGHDWGGAIAWVLGGRHAHRLRTLTSVSTPHPAAMAEVALRSDQLVRSAYIPFFRLPVAPEVVLTAANGAALRQLLRRSGLDGASADAYTDAMLAPGALRAALLWYRAASPRLSRTPSTTTPALHVWSTGDVALGRAAAEATVHRAHGPYRFEVLDGVSHWIPEEAPAALASTVLEHLGGDYGI